MSIEEEYLDVLQNMEAAIVSVYRQHPEMSDYDVDKALAALFITYRNEVTGKPAVKPNGNLANLVYEQVEAVCNWRLGRPSSFAEEGLPGQSSEALPVDIISRCIKRLRKSLETWTKQGGSQGYLNYISNFL